MIHVLDEAEAQQSILSRLANARIETDRLFEIVKPESLYARPIRERHRIIFYLGHLEAFDWNLLRDRLLKLSSFEDSFDRLFAFGIDPVDGGLPSDQPSDWPSAAEIARYNRRIRESIDSRLESLPFANGAGNVEGADFSLLLNVAIEHRLMHAETLAYLLHQLPLDQKLAPPPDEAITAPPVEARMIEIRTGEATLGLARSSGAFGWDNEFDLNRADVPAFEIDACKVTNGEFLRFVSDGGYRNPAFWSGEDWKWIAEGQIACPAFWRRSGETWLCRNMFAEIPLPLGWPVYVSHAEAAAYARWAGKKLPSEAQWHRAAYGAPEGRERDYPWGDRLAEDQGNFDFRRWDPVPVNADPAGRSAFGVEGMLGNGWEWTSSTFEPFPGFQPFPFYPGYSANFFDGEHYVMKGGSARTAACMLRRTFRNWFQPHYPYIYAAFRCVND
ncbi:MAG: SUMF1/EgtB/PvdO family nonheme iron enzyme [Terriglobia bacterium]